MMIVHPDKEVGERLESLESWIVPEMEGAGVEEERVEKTTGMRLAADVLRG